MRSRPETRRRPRSSASRDFGDRKAMGICHRATGRAAFERLAAEDFRFIEENGRMLNRAQYIADRSHNPDNVESAVQDEIEVRQYGIRSSQPAARLFMGRGMERHLCIAFAGRMCMCGMGGDGKLSRVNWLRCRRRLTSRWSRPPAVVLRKLRVERW
jgi:hypothetical protein